MKATGSILFGILFLIYLHLVHQIWRLVGEATARIDDRVQPILVDASVAACIRQRSHRAKLRRDIVNLVIAVTGLGSVCFFLIVGQIFIP